jgi:hypothetical protein
MSELNLRIQNLQDFKNILNQPAGARLIASLVDFCGVFSSSNSNKPNEGAREVGLMLYRMALDVDGGELAYIRGRKELEEILRQKEEQE